MLEVTLRGTKFSGANKQLAARNALNLIVSDTMARYFLEKYRY